MVAPKREYGAARTLLFCARVSVVDANRIRTDESRTAQRAGADLTGPPEHVRAQLDAQIDNRTIQDVNRVADKVAPPAGDTFAPGVGDAQPSPTNIIPANQVAQDLLANNRGLFIGEFHEVGNPAYRMTMDNMASFAEQGVRVLGLEAFDQENQNLLDNYRADPSEANRTALLNASKWEIGANEWVNLVDEAHENGIRVVGIDTAERRNINHGLSSHEVNSRWASAIDTAMAQEPAGSKFIAYGGLFHSSAAPSPNGVNQIMGIPSIVPADRNVYRDWNYYSQNGGYGVLGYQGGQYYALDTERRP